MRAFWFNVWLSCLAFVGSVCGSLWEMKQKQDASGVLALSNTIATYVNPRFQPLYLIVGLAGLSVMLRFAFEANVPKKAFYFGVSTLAVVTMSASYQAPKTLPSIPTQFQEPKGLPSSRWDLPGPNTQTGSPTAFAVSGLAISPPNLPTFGVAVIVNLKTPDPSASLDTVTITLTDSSTKEVVGRSTLSGKNLRFFASGGQYTLTVEVPGYRIEERQLDLQTKGFLTPIPLRKSVSLTISLEPTYVPAFIQKILPQVFFHRGGPVSGG